MSFIAMRKFIGPLHLPGLHAKHGPETITKRDPGNKAMGSTIGLLYNKRK
jgi:hypothetical protein